MRRRLTLMLGALCYLAFVSGVHADTIIRDDRGGIIGVYVFRLAALSLTDERIFVYGNCLSACTLMLGIIPRNRICAHTGAQFGFHAAWVRDDEGRPIPSPEGTEKLMQIYPKDVRRMIAQRGGLKKKMFYVPASTFVADCADARNTRAEASAKHPSKRKVRRTYASGR